MFPWPIRRHISGAIAALSRGDIVPNCKGEKRFDIFLDETGTKIGENV